MDQPAPKVSPSVSDQSAHKNLQTPTGSISAHDERAAPQEISATPPQDQLELSKFPSTAPAMGQPGEGRAKRPYDLVIFGASGSVGKFLVEEMALVVDKYYSNQLQRDDDQKQDGGQPPRPPLLVRQDAATVPIRRLSVPRHMDNIKWAVAGRSAVKLSETLCQAELATGIKGLASRVPILLADFNHHKSLLDMCAKTNLVINCAGPYYAHGELVIKACLEHSTHYIDLSHEPSFVDRMRRRYHASASAKKIFIINGCGFQSMAAEIGLNFVKQVADGKIDEVKVILNLSDTKAMAKSSRSGGQNKRTGIITTGMWSSFIAEKGQSTSSANPRPANQDHQEDRKTLKRKDTQSLVRDVVEVRNRNAFDWIHLLRGIDQAGSGYCFPMNSVTSEESQLIRGEMNNYELRKPDLTSTEGWRPIRCASFLSIRLLSDVIIFFVWMFFLNILIRFSPIRRVLRTFPSVFSFGNVNSVGSNSLDRDSLTHIKFSQTFLVYGTPSDESGDPLETRVKHLRRKQELILISRVVGPEPNHVATATFAVQAALAIIAETDHLPTSGGIVTPGAAFLDTNIIYQLRRRNIKFEVLKKA